MLRSIDLNFYLHFLRDFLRPLCLLCQSELKSKNQRHQMCHYCYTSLPFLQDGCVRCGWALPVGVSTCRGCVFLKTRLGDCFWDQSVMFSYDNPVDRMIQRFKYQGDLRMGRLLGYLFAEYAMGVITKRQWQFEVIIPVPLHPQGLFKRGFNQTLEMVRALSRTLKIPYDATGLQKTRGGASQMGLSKQARQINRLGDYQVVGCNKYRRILIVDDVLTTGATLNAILDALCERTESNLQCVYFLGLARQI